MGNIKFLPESNPAPGCSESIFVSPGAEAASPLKVTLFSESNPRGKHLTLL